MTEALRNIKPHRFTLWPIIEKSLLPPGLQSVLVCVLICVMNQGQWMESNHGEEVTVLDRKRLCTEMTFENRQT